MIILYNDFILIIQPPNRSTHFPYTTLFRSYNEQMQAMVTRWKYRGDYHLTNAFKQTMVQSFNKTFSFLLKNVWIDRKSTRLNSSHVATSYAVFCLKKKKITTSTQRK